MPHPSEILELGKLTFIMVIVLLLMTWTTVGLRMWVRTRITKSPGWDDATMLMALCLFTCYCAFIFIILLTGRAHRQFTEMELLQTLVYVQLSKIFYTLTTTFLKISLGLFFLRVLTRPWQTRLFKIVLAVSGVYGLFYFLVVVFACGNPSNLADNLISERADHCVPMWFSLSTGYLYGIVNVIADWIFTLIPIVILMDSTMDRRSKISVGVVMAFAAVGSLSSIMRMVYLKGLLFESNISANTIRATMWATAEPGTGIVAASAAVLRPLLRKIYTDVREKYGNSHQDPTKQWKTGATDSGDTESVIGLTSVANREMSDSRPSMQSMRSINPNEPWETGTSTEQARVGIERTVVITGGQGLKEVPSRMK